MSQLSPHTAKFDLKLLARNAVQAGVDAVIAAVPHQRIEGPVIDVLRSAAQRYRAERQAAANALAHLDGLGAHGRFDFFCAAFRQDPNLRAGLGLFEQAVMVPDLQIAMEKEWEAERNILMAKSAI